jgi:divalent metal cation (Fe/Co/Zn/Cd) transporter
VRTLIGLGIGIILFLVGVPVLQSTVKNVGYYDHFTYEQAVLAMLLVLACVIAAQLTALRPPKDKD